MLSDAYFEGVRITIDFVQGKTVFTNKKVITLEELKEHIFRDEVLLTQTFLYMWEDMKRKLSENKQS